MGTQGEQLGCGTVHHPGPFRMTGYLRTGSGLDGAGRAAWWKCGEDREQGQKWQRRTGLARAAFPVFLRLLHLVGEQSLSLLGGVCVWWVMGGLSSCTGARLAFLLSHGHWSFKGGGQAFWRERERESSPTQHAHTHTPLPAERGFVPPQGGEAAAKLLELQLQHQSFQ